MFRRFLSNQKVLFLVLSAILSVPLFASAVTTSTKGYYTMPLLSSDINKINAWVDHSYPGENKALSSSTIASSTMTMSDGTSWTGAAAASSTCGSGTSTKGCFNGNNGIYFSVARGKDVFSAASGTVKEVGWQSSANHKLGYGYYIWIKYPEYGESVIYGQLKESSTLVSVGSSTTRGMKIAVTSSTGDVTTSTLHFTVLNSLTSSSTVNAIDPYGWTGTSTDPWVKFDNGYLWASSAATSSVYNYVTSSYTMTASTTWNANQIYIIQNFLIVSSTATLTIPAGTVVKFDATSTYMQVDGTLKVNGTASSTVYFTSIEDDTVGGDTNNDGSSTAPGPKNWQDLRFNTGSSSTINYATIRYGGSYNLVDSVANIYAHGGNLTVNSSTILSDTNYGLYMSSGTVSIANTTISNAAAYGVRADNVGTLTLTGNTFTNNVNGVAYFDLPNGFVFNVPSNNTSSGSGNRGYFIIDSLAANQTWGPDLPYIPQALTIAPGTTLTINPGTIIKPDGGTITNNGTLSVQGTSANKVYLTSIRDDSVGGDTNADTTSTAPAAGDMGGIITNSGGTSTIDNAVIRYGGAALSYASFYQHGGHLYLSNSTIASSSYGIHIDGGIVNAATNVFQNNANDAVANNTNTTSSAIIRDNYWNSASGPTVASNPGGTGDPITDYVSYVPFLTSVPVNTSQGFASGTTPSQYRADGATQLGNGSTTPDNTTVFKATIATASGTKARLEVETQLAAIDFTGVPNASSSLVSSGTVATVTSTILANRSYHWQARVTNASGTPSAWQSFEASPTAIDFRVMSLTNAASEYFSTSTLTYSAASTTFAATDPFTVEFWYRSPVTSTAQAFLDTRNGPVQNGFVVFRDTNDLHGIGFVVNCDSGSIGFHAASSTFQNNGAVGYDPGIWHHVAITKNSGTTTGAFNFYFDGTAKTFDTTGGSGSISGNCFNSSADTIQFGKDAVATSSTNYNYLSGNLDEIRIWNVEKSASDIATYWNQEVTSTDSALKALWRFNNTSTDLASGRGISTSTGSTSFGSSTPFGHFILRYSSVSSSQLVWASSTQYVDNWNAAVATWNLENNIAISSTTVTSTANLIITDASDTSVFGTAVYCNVSQPWFPCPFPTSTKDTIFFNVPNIERGGNPLTADQKQAAATHELGHALGLDHSYFGNVMYPIGGLSQTSIGPQDKSDYHFIWGN